MTSTYENDFYSWTQKQAQLVRAKKFDLLDLEHISEELEDMGSNKRSALKSHLKVLLAHLLKWQYQPSYRGRSWTLTIEEQRQEIEDVLQENPGLKPEIPEQLKKAYRLAILIACKETGLALNVFPKVCPWSFEQIVDNVFLPL